MKTFTQILTESGGGLSRIAQHVKGRNIGTITAHRADYDAAENNRRNELLKNDLKDSGYGYKKVKGTYIEDYQGKNPRHVEENSFLVIGKKGDDKGKLKDFLTKHGEKYGQDSILHKPHNSDVGSLIGTNETGHPGKGNVASVGIFHPDRIAEFYSKHKGKNFAFYESIEIYEPALQKTFHNRTDHPDILIESYHYKSK